MLVSGFRNVRKPSCVALTVMAIVGGTARPENNDIKAIVCARPELGPSLGIAPEGQCTSVHFPSISAL